MTASSGPLWKDSEQICHSQALIRLIPTNLPDQMILKSMCRTMRSNGAETGRPEVKLKGCSPQTHSFGFGVQVVALR